MTILRAPAGGGTENRAFGLTRRFRIRAEDTAGAFCVFEEEVPEGAGPPLHVHRSEQELFQVVEGRLRFRGGEAEDMTGPGDMMLIPPGLPHAFKGAGPGTARVLITLTPGRGGGFFEAVEAEGLDPGHDMERIMQIAAEYDLDFVGPPLD